MLIVYTDDDDETSGKKDGDSGTKKSTFDWKKDKNGYDDQGRLSLRIDALEAEKYNAKKKNNFHNKPNPAQNLPNGIIKMRKKVRNVFDDDEDEDEWGVVVHKIPEDYDDTLMRALDENEKKIYDQQHTIQNVNMQQTAGKMEAIAAANRVAQEIGLTQLNKKDVNKEMIKAEFNPELAQKDIIKNDVLKTKGIKGGIELKTVKDVIQTARGIKKIEQINVDKKLDGIDAQDIKKAGQEKITNKEIAEIIIEKRGLKKDDAEQVRKNAENQKENIKNTDKNKQRELVEEIAREKYRGEKQRVRVRQ